MTRKYFTLLVKSDPRGAWCPEFGDYDRETVKDEMNDINGRDDVFACKIITTNDDQESIDRMVRNMNG